MKKTYFNLKYNILLLTVLTLLFADCTASKKSVKLDEPMIKLLRKEVKIYKQDEMDFTQYKIIKPIQALSCMRSPWDQAASEENAIDQLRYRAYVEGANAIFKVFCEPKETINYLDDCISSVTCHGVAIKILPSYR